MFKICELGEQGVSIARFESVSTGLERVSIARESISMAWGSLQSGG